MRVPNGFAATADTYRDMLTQAGAWQRLAETLNVLDRADVADPARHAGEVRSPTAHGFPTRRSMTGRGTVAAKAHYPALRARC